MEVQEFALHATPRDDLDAGAAGSSYADDEVVVFVTEMPRACDGGVTVVEIDRRHRAAVVSMPALGLWPRRGLVIVLTEIMRALSQDDPLRSGSRRRRWTRTHSGRTDSLRATGATNRLRLIAGMVLGNRPWRLIPTLTGLTAAAAAAASFGVFFSSIWSMANALSPVRLVAISILSMLLASMWLIVNNRLWERTTELPSWRTRLFNTVTACTVLFSSLALYAILFVATLLSAAIVIDAGYMRQELGRPVDVTAYVRLAWLATSMGIFAGALGSSADSHDDVLRATYGRRERLRRRTGTNPDEERSAGTHAMVSSTGRPGTELRADERMRP
ncbi:hypothetical protein [Gordonia sp. CPCC 206044]|uniref:hypothetical protein n=1 Tax=Gordonia sp. CPCC 206044 TaxID=3140793 RepID=UPI003AF3C189